MSINGNVNRGGVDFGPNRALVVVGDAGIGKSVFARIYATRRVLNDGYNAFFIDPHGEYGRVARVLGGSLESPHYMASRNITAICGGRLPTEEQAERFTLLLDMLTGGSFGSENREHLTQGVTQYLRTTRVNDRNIENMAACFGNDGTEAGRWIANELETKLSHVAKRLLRCRPIETDVVTSESAAVTFDTSQVSGRKSDMPQGGPRYFENLAIAIYADYVYALAEHDNVPKVLVLETSILDRVMDTPYLGEFVAGLHDRRSRDNIELLFIPSDLEDLTCQNGLGWSKIADLKPNLLMFRDRRGEPTQTALESLGYECSKELLSQVSTLQRGRGILITPEEAQLIDMAFTPAEIAAVCDYPSHETIRRLLLSQSA